MLVLIILKYINKYLISLFLINLIIKIWLKIALHILLKSIAITIRLIVAKIILNIEAMSSSISIVTLIGYRIIEYCKSKILKVIYEKSIISIIISWAHAYIDNNNNILQNNKIRI